MQMVRRDLSLRFGVSGRTEAKFKSLKLPMFHGVLSGRPLLSLSINYRSFLHHGPLRLTFSGGRMEIPSTRKTSLIVRRLETLPRHIKRSEVLKRMFPSGQRRVNHAEDAHRP